jgi:hypothetical protein
MHAGEVGRLVADDPIAKVDAVDDIVPWADQALAASELAESS